MPKVSVIIPVYNVEEYLPQCLDSVVNQTYNDLQIICVNDGSTDGSLNILNTYATKDNRIKVISQKNVGLSGARNTGIDAADGDFVLFVDSDDWLEINAIEEAINILEKEKTDVVCFSHTYFNGKEIIKNEGLCDLIEKYNHNSFFEQQDKSFFINVVWNKLYKTDIIKKNKITFPIEIQPNEDIVWGLHLFSYRPTISFLPLYLYNYRINRENSIMKTRKNCFEHQIKTMKKIFNSDYYKNADDEYKQVCIDKVLSGFYFFYNLEKNEKIKFKYTMELRLALPYILLKIPSRMLNNSCCYTNIRKIIGKVYYLDKIFSVKNVYRNERKIKHKIINICGLKIKIRMKNV